VALVSLVQPLARAAGEPRGLRDSRELTEAARLRCDALIPSMLGFGRQFLSRTVNPKALRSSSGNLAKFTVIRRALSRFNRSAAERWTQRYVRNRGRSGSARLALETTLVDPSETAYSFHEHRSVDPAAAMS
jgi:hypothetical protein